MGNELSELETLPDLFNDTGSEIDFVHLTSNESSDDSVIQSLNSLFSERKSSSKINYNEELLTRTLIRLRNNDKFEPENSANIKFADTPIWD
ncbi:hypothetical protein AVEN_230434-1 [Araneus ventricosus]|uniref:Uncharacterized protein n=1 Tax=Araneus ventricosus TaxID=182803 RepID=A0A4Y2LJ60_ARAVE|nr:hypothetical protein AVEN_230434-1 [Araneus ventricosus]